MIGGVAAESTFTIYDLHTADVPRSPRELPRLVRAALRIVWSAGRREAAIAIALQLVAGLGTAAVVLLGKQVIDGCWPPTGPAEGSRSSFRARWRWRR